MLRVRYPFVQAFILGNALAAAPQQPPRGSHELAPDLVVPLHTQASDQGVEYGIWGAGRGYKVSFHDGATVVPYLGRDAPTNQPWRWTTISATVGQLELCTRPPQLSHTAQRAEFALGGLVEAWDVRPDGVEQTFVLRQRPPTGGELVIRGRVESPLAADPREPAHAPVVFRDATGRAVLSYGAATAIDARGNRQPMTTAVDGATITLTLDADWLHAATYPVVVDPLVGVFFSIWGSVPSGAMDITCTSGAQGVWAFYERWASASDADLFLYRASHNGPAQTQVFTDLSASWSSIEPSIGSHQGHGCTLGVFSRHFTSNNTAKLRFHRHDVADFSLSGSWGSVSTGNHQAWRPAVSSERQSASPRPFLVVFQLEELPTFAPSLTSKIYGVEIDASTATGNAGAVFPIATTPGADHERPTITDGLVELDERIVAYQTIGVSPIVSPHVDWDVQLLRVSRSGAVGTPLTLGLANGQHEVGARLAGTDDGVLLACMRARPGDVGARPDDVNGHRIRTWPVRWNGTDFDLGPGDAHYNESNPRLYLDGFDRDRFTSLGLLSVRSTATQNIYLRLIGFNAMLVRTETLHTAAPNTSASAGAVASEPLSRGFVAGYGLTTAVPGYRVWIDRYEHVATPTPGSGGLGCGTGTLSWAGEPLIGNADCRVRLFNVPPGALAAVLVAVAPFSQLLVGVPPVAPGCWLNVPNTGPTYLGTLPIGFGPNLSWPLALPEFLDPGDLFFQGVHFDAANATAYTTERLRVSLVK